VALIKNPNGWQAEGLFGGANKPHRRLPQTMEKRSMSTEAPSLFADETRLVKSEGLKPHHERSAVPQTSTVGYDAAAALLREFRAPYSTKESLKSICSKIRRGERIVQYFPLPVVQGQTVLFDRRRLIAWALWRNGGPEPVAIYRNIDLEEARLEVALQRATGEAERELKLLLAVLAGTDRDAAVRLSTTQLRLLVRRFKDLLFEYDWDFDRNKPRSTW
jgi:hypothetical protein